MRIKICRKEAIVSAWWLRLKVKTSGEKYAEVGNKLLRHVWVVPRVKLY